MAGALSTYQIKKLGDYFFGAQAYSPPANVTLKLYTVSPSATGGGTEVSTSGTGYSAKTIANNTTNFPAMDLGGNKYLNTAQTWTPSGSWGTVVAWGLWDGSNLLFFGPLTTPQAVESGDSFTLPAGEGGLKITPPNAGISNWLWKKMMDLSLGAVAPFSPDAPGTNANIILKMYTVAPGLAGGGTEVSTSGTNYASKTITNNNTNFPDMVSGSGLKFLNTAQSWSLSGATAWGSTVAWGLWDTSGANLMAFGAWPTPLNPSGTDTASVPAGEGGLSLLMQ